MWFNVIVWSFIGLCKMMDHHWEGWFTESGPWFIVALAIYAMVIRNREVTK